MGAPEIIVLICFFVLLIILFYFGRKVFDWLSKQLKKMDKLQESIDELNKKTP